MLSYRHVATYLGAETWFVTNITDLRAFQAPSGYALYSATHVGGGMAAFRITAADQPIQLIGTRAYAPQMGYLDSPHTALLEMGGRQLLFGTGLRHGLGNGIELGGDGGLGNATALAGPGRLGNDVTLMGSFTTASGEFIYTGRDGKTAFETWKVNPNGSLTQVGRAELPWGDGIQGTQIDDMHVVTLADRTFMLTASAQGNYVSIQSIGADGVPGVAQFIWADRGLGLNAPAHIATVTVLGVTYLIVGSGQSSSLTTMRVNYNGTLEPVDHIIDELGTRFQGASALDTVMLGGRAFVFVGGADDGISVLTLMPNGHLLHLTTLVDADDRTLADVSDIAAMVIDGRIVVFVASRSERGITQFVFDPGRIGMTTTLGGGSITGTAHSDMLRAGPQTTAINGGAGDDILIAGIGPVKLTGGDGADMFVASEVNGRINIMDFEPGIDQLDLSGLGMIRSMMQLVFSPQSNGIKIFFGNSVVWIRTRDGSSLQAGYFDNSLFPIAHYDPPNMRTRISGTMQGDTLTAGRYGSNIYGLGGHDMLIGREGADIVLGGAGNDTLRGGAGNDQLWGNDGNDLIRGDDGNDLIRGGAGNDTLYGGAGNDTIHGEAGNDSIYGEAGNDIIEDLLGHNAIWSGAGNDRITTGNGNDRVFAQEGDDTVNGGAGNDRIWGGAGNDRLLGGAGRDTIYGDVGNDYIEGGDGDDFLQGDDGNDTLFGQNGHDRADGGAGNDLILGGPGNDTLMGNGGNDTLWGGAGNDSLHGDAGDDVLRGEDGRDRLLGGDGNDTLMGMADRDTLNGQDGDDMLYGGDGNDLLVGAAGNDTLWGEGGNDKLFGMTGNDVLLGHAGNDTLGGQEGHDTLWGGEGNDRLDGHDGDDLLMGEAGDDFMLGGAGNDTLLGGTGNDSMRGSEGADQLHGQEGNDTLEGGWGADTLWGGDGNDVLRGSEGIDWLSGDAGDDSLDGGAGNDTLLGGEGNDTLQDVQGDNLLDGGVGDDLVWGGPGMDTLIGGAGDDTLRGGPGPDVFVFRDVADFDGGTDVITDFQSGSDVIDLRGLGLTHIGETAFSGAAQVRSTQDATLGRVLQVDVDGDGHADLTIALGNQTVAEGDLLL